MKTNYLITALMCLLGSVFYSQSTLQQTIEADPQFKKEGKKIIVTINSEDYEESDTYFLEKLSVYLEREFSVVEPSFYKESKSISHLVFYTRDVFIKADIKKEISKQGFVVLDITDQPLSEK